LGGYLSQRKTDRSNKNGADDDDDDDDDDSIIIDTSEMESLNGE